jgi:hypothetical protein
MNSVSAADLEKRGIFRVPSTLHDAVAFLEKDKVLLDGMGPLGKATGGLIVSILLKHRSLTESPTVYMRRYEANFWGKMSYEEQMKNMVRFF